MKHQRYLVPIILLILVACIPGVRPPTESTLPGTSIPASTATPVIQNLAMGKSVSASSLIVTGLPLNAVDGNLETVWSSGKSSPQWIQIDLDSPASISRISLIVAQDPGGNTIHQIYAGASELDLALVHEFAGSTADGDLLEYIPEIPMHGIRYVKILTTESPSWVAWRDIEILGNEELASTTLVQKPVVDPADVIYYNGQILTMEPDQPLAEAIAIRGDIILAVGTKVDVFALQGAGTTLIDLDGLTMTPGFIDSHAHRIGDRWLFGDPSAEQMMEKALSQGWTSLHELFVFDQRLVELVNIDRAGAMPVRISMYLTMNFEYTYDLWWQAYQPLQQYSPYLQIAGLKITLDREWGEQIFFTQEQYTQMVLDGTEKGWQIATHSFSPAANQIVLNGYAAALNGQSNDLMRLRLEHIGTMTDDELRQMADLGIIGSVGLLNSGSLPDDASFIKYIPASEVEHTARWRDLIDAGVFLIGNTDDPWCCTDWRNNSEEPPNDATVMAAIYQGVTFNTFKGREAEPWQTAQVLTVQEALKMLTIHSAYAAHQENVIGSLKPGKYADLVILSGNPLTTPVEQIPGIAVLMTMVGGDVKYCAPGQTVICGK